MLLLTLVLGHAVSLGCQSTLLPWASSLQSVEWTSCLHANGPYKKEIANSVVGWRLGENTISRLPSLLSGVLQCECEVTSSGVLNLLRSKDTEIALDRAERDVLIGQLNDLVKQRGNHSANERYEDLVTRIQNYTATRTKDQKSARDIVNLTPACELLCKLVSKIGHSDLTSYLNGAYAVFSTKPGKFSDSFSFNFQDELQRYSIDQSRYTEQILASSVQSGPGNLMIRSSIPDHPFLPGPKHVVLILGNGGSRIMPLLGIFDHTGRFEAEAGIGNQLDSERSAVSDETEPVEPSAIRPKLSNRSLVHFAGRELTAWDLHSGNKTDSHKNGDDPRSVLVDPQIADPLSFEVQDAFEGLAKWKGASGWVANCPDSAYAALPRSVIKGFIDLPTFERLLGAQGNCSVKVDDGILVIAPLRPILAKQAHLDRHALQRCCKALQRTNQITIRDACDFATATLSLPRDSLRSLFEKAVYAGPKMKSSPFGLGTYYMDYAFLNAIKEPYLSGVLDGSGGEIPEEGVDWDRLYLNGAVLGYTFQPGTFPTLNLEDLAPSLMESKDGVSPSISSWTEVIPAVRRVRVRTFDEVNKGITIRSRSKPGGKPEPMTSIDRMRAAKVGDLIDNWWVPASQLTTLPNEFELLYARRKMTEVDVRSRYLYVTGEIRAMHFRIHFPSGRWSQWFGYYTGSEDLTKPRPFDQLPENTQQIILAKF